MKNVDPTYTPVPSGGTGRTVSDAAALQAPAGPSEPENRSATGVSKPQAGVVHGKAQAADASGVKETDSLGMLTADSLGLQAADSLGAQAADSLGMQAADSLGIQAADSLWENPLSAFMPGDSLYHSATTLRYLPDGTPLEHFRTVGTEEMFGPQAELVTVSDNRTAALPRLTDEIPFQGLVLLLGVVFGLLLYHYPNDIRALVARVAFERRDSERGSEESGNAGFTRFLNIALALGFLFTGIAAVRLCDRPEIVAMLLQEGGGAITLFAALSIALAALLFYLYGIMLLRIVGSVTLTVPFTSQLIRLKRGYAALGAVILGPVVLLFALSPSGNDAIWAGVLAAGSLVTFLLYLRETFALFISKNVSILHWILYLCAVEIFPVSLLWLLVVRLGAQP